MLSLESSERGIIDFCAGLQYLTDVMDLEIMLEVEAKECNYGLFGAVIGDITDCYWKKYVLPEPIAGIHFLNAFDTVSEYVPWYCNYE
jgi:hypothetical protein